MSLDGKVGRKSRSLEVVGECAFETVTASRLSVRTYTSGKKLKKSSTVAATDERDKRMKGREKVGLGVLSQGKGVGIESMRDRRGKGQSSECEGSKLLCRCPKRVMRVGGEEGGY